MNTMVLSNEFLIAVLGIIGTLLGTVLGWVLNNLSQKGKLNIFIAKWNEVFEKREKYGSFIKCNSLEEAEYYQCELSLDIYNSSRDTRIMRGVRIVFMDKKKKLFEITPRDDSTKRQSSPLVHYDEVTVINVEARSVINLNLHDGINNSDDNWNLLYKANRIVLEYLDEKNKGRRINLCKR